MWKYQCKKQLLFILSGFIFGMILFGVLQYQNDMMKELLYEVAVSVSSIDASLQTETIYQKLVSYPFIIPLLGGISVAGIVNGISLFFYLVQKFQLSYFFVFVLLLLGVGNLAYQIGSILLIPSIFVYIFGWLTIPKGKKVQNKTNISQIEHTYTLHHKLQPSHQKLAKSIARNLMILNALLGFGAFFVVLLILYVQDFTVLLLGMLIFLCLSFYVNKRKSMMMQPIISLLYDACDPEACASTIIYLTKYLYKRKKFVLTPVLSQCMIYLNDPHLAIEILALDAIQTKNGVQHTYYSLMGYAYYQLGDKMMVQHQFDMLEKEVQKMKKTPFLLLAHQALYAIQNKLNMLNGEFEKVEVYYQRFLQTTPLKFQQVDANYYLGLIAFVNKDLSKAESSFSFVVQHGNQLYIVEKAKQYLEKIAQISQQE